MTAFRAYGLVVVGSFSMGSCSAINPPLANPVIVNSFDGASKGVYTVATTADRRLVFVNAQNGTTCMEAPPDATENVSSSLSATLAATLQNASGASPEVKAALATQIASALAHVTQPSQGILLYRFGMSNLCNRFLNGAIDAQEYKTYAEELLVVARELTYQELLATNGKIGPEVKTSEAPSTGARSCRERGGNLKVA
jgi:hypothetical protein